MKQSHPTEPFSTHTQIEVNPIFYNKKLIPWLGGKHRLARKIIELLPEHTCYCEVFAGGASVFWQKPRSKMEVLNDINRDIINLYRVVQNHLEEFIRQIQWMVKSRDEFNRQLMLPPEALTDIQRAVRFFYIIKNAFSGRYSKSPSFGIDTGKSTKAFSVRSIEELLIACHERLDHVILECLDWRDCLSRYDREGTVFYLDPPYYGCENDYGNTWQRDDFYELAEKLKNIKGKFILSINDLPETRQIFRAFEFLEVQTKYSASPPSSRSKTISQLLIKNF